MEFKAPFYTLCSSLKCWKLMFLTLTQAKRKTSGVTAAMVTKQTHFLLMLSHFSSCQSINLRTICMYTYYNIIQDNGKATFGLKSDVY